MGNNLKSDVFIKTPKKDKTPLNYVLKGIFNKSFPF